MKTRTDHTLINPKILMEAEHVGPRVFMLPWLAYGHISPHLELAKRLSERGFYIYLCSTPVNLKSVEKNITNSSSSSSLSSIQIVEFHLQSLPELPPESHTTNGLPLHLMPTLKKALNMAKPTLSNLLESLNPDLIIHDPFIPWAAGVASALNIPAIRFLTSSAATCSYFAHLAQRPGIEFPFPDVRLTDFEQANLNRVVGSMRSQRDPEDESPERFRNMILLLKTSREIEGKYIDYLSELMNANIIPVSPLVQDPVCNDDDQDENIELIEWLGKKNVHSTVFISFGSECYLKKEEIEELAFGLELSNVNFIWVIRFPKGESISVEEALPVGFLERIGDRGRVVDGWVPQAKILSHASIGGFVSHCGWNSTLESLEFGVPLIAMPMHLDQPLNAKLMVEIGVAVEVMKDENGNLQREEVGKALSDVILGTMADKVRKQVREIRQKVKMIEKQEIDEAYRVLLAQICDSNKINQD